MVDVIPIIGATGRLLSELTEGDTEESNSVTAENSPSSQLLFKIILLSFELKKVTGDVVSLVFATDGDEVGVLRLISSLLVLLVLPTTSCLSPCFNPTPTSKRNAIESLTTDTSSNNSVAKSANGAIAGGYALGKSIGSGATGLKGFEKLRARYTRDKK